MFNQEYKCPNCGDTFLFVVVEEEGDTIESRGEDFCETCDFDGPLVPIKEE